MKKNLNYLSLIFFGIFCSFYSKYQYSNLIIEKIQKIVIMYPAIYHD